MTRIEEILPLLCGEFVCMADGEKRVFQSKEDLEKSGRYKNYTVSSISVQDGKLVLELAPWQIPAADSDSEWAKEYTEKNGKEPGFF